jgi:hypothetical protein
MVDLGSEGHLNLTASAACTGWGRGRKRGATLISVAPRASARCASASCARRWVLAIVVVFLGILSLVRCSVSSACRLGTLRPVTLTPIALLSSDAQN